MKPDQKFFDIFSIVIGVLIAITFGIYILADNMSEKTQGAYTKETEEYRSQMADRIRPVGQVSLPGDELAVPVAAEPAVVETVVAEAKSGDAIYNSACLACHAAGVAGAPMMGNKEAWAPRIAQGADVLYTHAINGFQGATGFMPAKGGRVDFSDQEIKNAVDYMVGQSK